jgi:hypothetical protein
MVLFRACTNSGHEITEMASENSAEKRRKTDSIVKDTKGTKPIDVAPHSAAFVFIMSQFLKWPETLAQAISIKRYTITDMEFMCCNDEY